MNALVRIFLISIVAVAVEKLDHGFDVRVVQPDGTSIKHRFAPSNVNNDTTLNNEAIEFCITIAEHLERCVELILERFKERKPFSDLPIWNDIDRVPQFTAFLAQNFCMLAPTVGFIDHEDCKLKSSKAIRSAKLASKLKGCPSYFGEQPYPRVTKLVKRHGRKHL